MPLNLPGRAYRVSGCARARSRNRVYIHSEIIVFIIRITLQIVQNREKACKQSFSGVMFMSHEQRREQVSRSVISHMFRSQEGSI